MRTQKIIGKFISIVMISLCFFSTPAAAATGSTTVYRVPAYNGFKSYERGILENGKCIFHKNTRQRELQTMARSTKTGFRRVNKRYLVAVGTRISDDVGQYITLVLKNGTNIPCIVGDIKADRDTDETNTFTANGCCSEFIVDIRRLSDKLKEGGNISEYKETWDSPVTAIIVHDENVFTE